MSNPSNTELKRQCSICKEVKTLNSDNFPRNKSEKYGFDYNCKICEAKRVKGRYRKMTPEQRRDRNISKSIESKARRIISTYRRFDKKKKLQTNLSIEFVISSLNSKCTYCEFESCGLDRKDNTLGHIELNCVPCCKECNIARMDNFTYEEMILIGETIKKIKLSRLSTPGFFN